MIGAGAAGLAAARELARAGRSVLVLEARGRVGGRCWTRRMSGSTFPVELGAEFIHGEAEATHALLREAGASAFESTREQRYLDRGTLRPVNAFIEAQNAVEDVAIQWPRPFVSRLPEAKPRLAGRRALSPR